MANTTKRFLRFFTAPTFWVLSGFGNLFLFTAVTIVYYLERNTNSNMESYLDAVWWGVTTITTVGYGDVVPTSTAARIIGIILMYSGTVLFISFTSLLATYWVRAEVEREISPIEKGILREERETHRIEKQLKEVQRRLERLEKK